VGQDFAAEAPRLLALPADVFDTASVLWLRADRYARVSIGKCRYSVPARLIGARVRVALSANELAVFDGSKRVAVHPRLSASGAEHLDLDHYLEILLRKPGALPGAAALAQARAAGTFTAAHDAFWAAARARHGDGAGTRALIDVLLLHRRMAAPAVIAGITAALAAGPQPESSLPSSRPSVDATNRAEPRRRSRVSVLQDCAGTGTYDGLPGRFLGTHSGRNRSPDA
jgi:hypothetical protein